MAETTYGDISPRTAAYASKEMLRRGIPNLVIENFGQAKPLPKNKTDSVKFRRYEALDPSPNSLSEGVTPTAQTLSSTDVTATLTQYGNLVQISDVIADTHEDPVLNESVDLLGEQQAQMLETVRFNTLKAGTNVMYANGSSRGDVNTPVSKNLLRGATRALKRQNASKITKVIRSTPSFETVNVAQSYIAFVHPDLENDIRELPGFTPVEQYGSLSPWEAEIGKTEDIRFLSSTIFQPWEGEGSATIEGMVSEGGDNVDVYPILVVAKDAYGLVPLKGKGAVTPSVVNPNNPSSADPLGQRGYVGWKAYHTAVILNDAWMIRLEVGATDL